MPTASSLHLVFLAEFQFEYLLPAAGIVMIITSVVMWQRTRKLRGGAGLTPTEELERNKQLRGMRGDLEELMVEIEQLAKRLSAQLDAKTIELDLATHRADERLKELRRLTDGGGTSGGNGNSGGRTSGQSATPAASAIPSTAAKTEPEQGPVDPLARSVHQLADKGLAASAIAQQLNEHIGKIELILALRQSSKADL